MNQLTKATLIKQILLLLSVITCLALIATSNLSAQTDLEPGFIQKTEIAGGVPVDRTPTAVPPTAVPGGGGETVNCDNQWNLIDAILIKRNDAFLIPSVQTCTAEAIANQEMYEPECDRNGDGRCTLVDAVIIQQCNAFVTNAFCAAIDAVNNG